MPRTGSTWNELILSIFPGIDLLGTGFEREGACVVRGPDLIFGGDIFEFHPSPGKFEGVIGGSPCQKFSLLNRERDLETGAGVELLAQFVRVVVEAKPKWFLLENVPSVPSISVPGYRVQRFNLRASECGGRQIRNRCFQFGSCDEKVLSVDRADTVSKKDPSAVFSKVPAALASEGNKKTRRNFEDFCELQGLPRSFDLPGMSVAAKYRAVGNGVPVFMARILARAVRDRIDAGSARFCRCECGRLLVGRQTSAGPACRKRLERFRRTAFPFDFKAGVFPGV